MVILTAFANFASIRSKKQDSLVIDDLHPCQRALGFTKFPRLLDENSRNKFLPKVLTLYKSDHHAFSDRNQSKQQVYGHF